MAGSTTNLGLTKPTYSEDADIAVINTNMDTLDSKIGAVGSTSLQAQITSANQAIATLNSKITYVWTENYTYRTVSALIEALATGSLTKLNNLSIDYCLINGSMTNGNSFSGYAMKKNSTYSYGVITYGNTPYSFINNNGTVTIQEVALKSDADITSVLLTGSSNVQYATSVSVRRTGNIMTVKINGLSALPNGGYTDICTLPSGFIPAENLQYDVLAGTDNNATSLRTLRVRVETNGKLMLYNYGTQFTNTNIEITAIFIA